MAGDSLSDIQSLVPRRDIGRFVGAMKFPILLSIGQAVSMAVNTVVFVSNEAVANFIYRNLNFFENYIPILFRYRVLYAERGSTNEFGTFFSIHLFSVFLQGVVLTLLAIFLFRLVRGRRPDCFGLKKNILWFLFLLILALPSVDLIYGIDIAQSGFFSSAYLDCLIVPVFNLLFYFIVYARFWESYYAQSISRNYRIDELRS